MIRHKRWLATGTIFCATPLVLCKVFSVSKIDADGNPVVKNTQDSSRARLLLPERLAALKFKYDPTPTLAVIIAANALVIGGWRLLAPRSAHMARFMHRNFIWGTPNRGKYSYPAFLLHAFSHREIWHFGLNMYCLYTFANRLKMIFFNFSCVCVCVRVVSCS